MKPRRSFLSFAVALLGAVTGKAQMQGSTNVRVLARHPLQGPHEGLEATLVEVTIPPGTGSKAHRHPGFVLGYVLDGEFRFGVNGQPDQVLKAGGTFFEPVGAVHSVSSSARPDQSAKILAFMVAEKGKQITLPV